MMTTFRPQSPKIERAIILYVLEHDEATRTELADALRDDPMLIDSALEPLRAVGLVIFSGEDVRPTIACRYIDQLDLIDVSPS